MYNKDLNTQYEIMDVKTENGFIPNFDDLIAESPNDEMKSKWMEAKAITEKHGGFTFNGVYMLKMECGHYEVFQHSAKDESDLIDWIKLMQVEEKNRKCTMCICDL